MVAAARQTTPRLAEYLVLPAVEALPEESVTRKLALIEKMGMGRGADGEEIEGPSRRSSAS